MRNILKKYYFRQIVTCWMICSMLLAFAPVRVAEALPSGWNVTYGGSNAIITQPDGTHILVSLQQLQTIIHWNSLDTSLGEFLTFDKGTLVNPAVLNRVMSGNMTTFNGTLNGAGVRVFIINPAGIVFGSGATINVGQLVASSLDITDNDFLNQDGTPYEYMFKHYTDIGSGVWDAYALQAGATENVEFWASQYGATLPDSIYLIGKNVFNYGALKANKCVVMAAGDSVYLSEKAGSPVVVEAYMPAGWQSGSGIHVVGNDGSGITVDESLDVDGDGTAQVVLAAGDIWSAALVKAYTDGGSDAVATVDIAAAGDFTVTDNVIAEALGDGKNDAFAAVTVDAGRNVEVIAEDGDQSSIQAKTQGGMNNTSEIFICTDGLRVKAEGGWEDTHDIWHGSTASIEAIAESSEIGHSIADVQIGACKSIDVTAISDYYILDNALSTEAAASITAKATGGAENTARVLACAKNDVQVIAEKAGEAMIKSEAGAPWEEALSNAETTIISHEGAVVVDSSLDGDASIESVLSGLSAGTATTQIYATSVGVIGGGSFIRAIWPGGVLQRGDGFSFCATSDGKIAETDGTAIFIIDSSRSEDCPDCPPCPCRKVPPPLVPEGEAFAPVAPLPPYHIPRIEGCPELTQAAAAELGIVEETLQVGMGNSLALNPNVQPCQACALLVNNAAILKDVDGSRMAAMIQVFNAIAPADAPYTPEMATSIAMTFDNAAEGSQYASTMEFIDAFVQYAAALGELGSPTGDSTTFVMDKYGAGLSDNGNMATFIAGRIEGSQTF